MTLDQYADYIEAHHRAVVDAVKVAINATTNKIPVWDRFITDDTGSIWNGLITKDNGDVHCYMVSQDDLSVSRLGETGGDFFSPITFNILGCRKFKLGTSETNNEKPFRRERAKILKTFEDANLNTNSVLMNNTGFKSRFMPRRISAGLVYEIRGVVTIIPNPVSRG